LTDTPLYDCGARVSPFYQGRVLLRMFKPTFLCKTGVLVLQSHAFSGRKVSRIQTGSEFDRMRGYFVAVLVRWFEKKKKESGIRFPAGTRICFLLPQNVQTGFGPQLV